MNTFNFIPASLCSTFLQEEELCPHFLLWQSSISDRHPKLCPGKIYKYDLYEMGKIMRSFDKGSSFLNGRSGRNSKLL